MTGDEEHVSGWDLIYDNGFIEIDPEQCGYTTFLGAAVPTADDDGKRVYFFIVLFYSSHYIYFLCNYDFEYLVRLILHTFGCEQ